MGAGDGRRAALTVNGTLILSANGVHANGTCCGGLDASAAAAGGVLALVADNALLTGTASLMGRVEVGAGVAVGAGGLSVRMGGVTVGAGGLSVHLGGAVVYGGGASVLGGGVYAANDATSPGVTARLSQGGGRTAGTAGAFQVESLVDTGGSAYTAMLADNGGGGVNGGALATPAVQLGGSALVALRFTTGDAQTMLVAVIMQFLSNASDIYSVRATLYAARANVSGAGGDDPSAGLVVPDLGSGPAFAANSATAAVTFTISAAAAAAQQLVPATLDFPIASWPVLAKNKDYFLVFTALSATGTVANNAALFVASAAQTRSAAYYSAAVAKAAGQVAIAVPSETPALTYDATVSPPVGWAAAIVNSTATMAVALLGGPPNPSPTYSYAANLGYAGDVVAIAGPTAAQSSGQYNVLALRAGKVDGSDAGQALTVDCFMDLLSTDSFVVRTADVLTSTAASGDISLVVGRSYGNGGVAVLKGGYGFQTGGDAQLAAGDGLVNGGVGYLLGGDGATGSGGNVVLQPGTGAAVGTNGVVAIKDAAGTTRILVDKNGELVFSPASGAASLVSASSMAVDSAAVLSLTGATRVAIAGAGGSGGSRGGDVVVQGGATSGLLNGGSVSLFGGPSSTGTAGVVRVLSSASASGVVLNAQPTLRLEVADAAASFMSDGGSATTVLKYGATPSQGLLQHAGALSVAGATSFYSNVNVYGGSLFAGTNGIATTGALSVSGATAGAGGLFQAGASSLLGTVYTGGMLSVNGDGVAFGTAAFVNGNVKLVGSGALSLAGDLTAGGDVLTAGALSVGGGWASLLGDATVGGNLAVGGAVTSVVGDLKVGGSVSLNSLLSWTDVQVNGNLDVGYATKAGSLSVYGSTVVGSQGSLSLLGSSPLVMGGGTAFLGGPFGALSVGGGGVASAGGLSLLGSSSLVMGSGTAFMAGLSLSGGGAIVASGSVSLTGTSTHLYLTRPSAMISLAGGLYAAGAVSAYGGLSISGGAALVGTQPLVLGAGGMTGAPNVLVAGFAPPLPTGGPAGTVTIAGGSALLDGGGGSVVLQAGAKNGNHNPGFVSLRDELSAEQLRVDGAAGVTINNALTVGSGTIGGTPGAALTVGGSATFNGGANVGGGLVVTAGLSLTGGSLSLTNPASSLDVAGMMRAGAGFAPGQIGVCSASEWAANTPAACGASAAPAGALRVNLWWNADSAPHSVDYGGTTITIAMGAIFPVYS